MVKLVRMYFTYSKVANESGSHSGLCIFQCYSEYLGAQADPMKSVRPKMSSQLEYNQIF